MKIKISKHSKEIAYQGLGFNNKKEFSDAKNKTQN